MQLTVTWPDESRMAPWGFSAQYVHRSWGFWRFVSAQLSGGENNPGRLTSVTPAPNVPDGRTPAELAATKRLASEIKRRGERVVTGADDVLFRQGDAPDCIYYLKTGGAILTMRADDGPPILTLRADAGSILGLPAVTGERPYSLTACTSASTEVYKLGCSEFKKMLQSDPSLALDLLAILAAEVRSTRVLFAEHAAHISEPDGKEGPNGDGRRIDH